jgi:hypothetical protein
VNPGVSGMELCGEKIRVLLHKKKEFGYILSDVDNIDFPSRVYFYQLKASNPESSSGQVFIDTKKMLLLK